MNVRPALALVHSPLLGPVSWEPVRLRLAAAGWNVVVPRLLNDAGTGSFYWQRHSEDFREALDVAAIGGAVALIGHSGAGPLLPVLAAASGRASAAYLFVDSDLPVPESSRFDAFDRAEDVERVRSLATDGMLAPWNEWFGEEVMSDLIPDEATRLELLAELRPAPLAIYEEILPIPVHWPDAACGYLQLSSGYQPQSMDAEARGWPVERLASNHLGMVAESDAVTAALLNLLSMLL